MTIKHSNIVYVKELSQLGGVETWVYEIAKKYHNLDLAVVVKRGDHKQLDRLSRLVPVYKHTDEKIECDVAIINYDTSIIPYIDAKIGIYQTIHGDYENPVYHWSSPTSPKIKEYICITDYLMKSVNRITGNTNLRLSYNPLTIEKSNKPIILLSATRLSEIKGGWRMKKLANALDDANVNYVWFIFTNDTNNDYGPNVFFSSPTLDIDKWFDMADFVIQLSDTEACSYTIAEALFRNKPIITTPLPYLDEIGVKDGENSYIMEFDCSNIDHIVDNITNIPKFSFKKWEDSYVDIFTSKKKPYDPNKEVKIVIKRRFYDNSFNKNIPAGSVITVPMHRAMLLSSLGIGIIKEKEEDD